MRAAVLFLLVTAGLAGCFGSDDAGSGDDYEAGIPTTIPFACEDGAPAIVHGPAGAPVEWDGPGGVACIAYTGEGSFEPSLGVTSDGTLFFYPALPSQVLGSVGPFPDVIGAEGMAVSRSQDGGASFERVRSDVGPANYHPLTLDPYLYVDPYSDRVFMEDLVAGPFCSNLSFSDDKGESWTQTVGGCLVADHVGFASGPPVTSVIENDYPTILQRCALMYGATALASEGTGCQKSIDGGMTWQPPGEAAFTFDESGLPYVPSFCDGGAHHPFIDHRGWTYIARLWCDGNPWVAVSKDEGATWQQHQIGTGAAPWHDVGIGVDTAGTAYAFWIDAELRPVVAVSFDDAVSWSEPIDISPPGLVAAGMVNVAPAGRGNSAFSYAAEFADRDGVHAVVVGAYGLDTEAPRFHSAIATPPDAPLVAGGVCSGGTCDQQTDFLDVTIGADNMVWGSFVAEGEGAAGGLWGAPLLWGVDDPNGPYAG